MLTQELTPTGPHAIARFVEIVGQVLLGHSTHPVVEKLPERPIAGRALLDQVSGGIIPEFIDDAVGGAAAAAPSAPTRQNVSLRHVKRIPVRP